MLAWRLRNYGWNHAFRAYHHRWLPRYLVCAFCLRKCLDNTNEITFCHLLKVLTDLSYFHWPRAGYVNTFFGASGYYFARFNIPFLSTSFTPTQSQQSQTALPKACIITTTAKAIIQKASDHHSINNPRQWLSSRTSSDHPWRQLSLI